MAVLTQQRLSLNLPNMKDLDAFAIALFALATQLEREYPGTAGKYGWARIDDLRAFAKLLGDAYQATPPDGLH